MAQELLDGGHSAAGIQEMCRRGVAQLVWVDVEGLPSAYGLDANGDEVLKNPQTRNGRNVSSAGIKASLPSATSGDDQVEAVYPDAECSTGTRNLYVDWQAQMRRGHATGADGGGLGRL